MARYWLALTRLLPLPCPSTAVKIKKSKGATKFKVRCSRYLYTLTVKDADKADKLKQSLPPGASACVCVCPATLRRTFSSQSDSKTTCLRPDCQRAALSERRRSIQRNSGAATHTLACRCAGHSLGLGGPGVCGPRQCGWNPHTGP